MAPFTRDRTGTVEVRLNGQWQQARRVFDGFGGLGFKIRKAAERHTAEEARLVALRLKRGIEARTYEALAGFEPLSPETVARKEREGVAQPDRALIETGAEVEGIQVMQLGRAEYFVGVADPDLVMRTAVNEFGTTDGHVPARPVFRTEAERGRTASGRLGNLQAALNRILRGMPG